MKKPTVKKPATKKAPAKKPATRKTTTRKPTIKQQLEAAEKQLAALEQKAEVEKQEAIEEALRQASLIKVTIRHGLSRSHTVECQPSDKVADILSDPDLRAILGFGENVKAISDGQELMAETTIDSLGSEPTISLETRENKKA